MSTEDYEIRMAASLVQAAELAGAREGRSGSKQLEYWAEVGRAVAGHSPSTIRRVRQALQGEIAPENLEPVESVIFNADVEARIEARMSQVNFATRRAERGLSSVALNEDGEIIEIRPDGTTRALPRN